MRTMQHFASAWVLACLGGLVHGASLIWTETWMNRAGSGTSGTFTVHQYDSTEKQTSKRVHKSLDSSGSILSQTEYSYDSQQRLVKEELALPGSLGSMIEYAYDGMGRLVAMAGKSGDGLEKYSDSLAYDSSGTLFEQRRYKGTQLQFYHRFGVGPGGKRISDVAFENDGSGFVATQAMMVNYDGLGRRISETSSRIVDDIWFVSKTKRWEYNQAFLAKYKESEGDGESGNLLLATVYRYDAKGNKVKEETSDGAGKILHVTVFTWWEGRHAETSGVLPGLEQPRPPTIRIQGPFILAKGKDLKILDLRGRRLHSSEEIYRSGNIHLSSPSILMIPGGSQGRIKVKGR